MCHNILSLCSNTFNRELVEKVVAHLEGAYALAFKSVHYPGECVVACCGSPLILGTPLSCLRLSLSSIAFITIAQGGQTGFYT